MNGFIEPLPGLLDDPQFQLPSLPSLPDVHIAPLRNPAPSKHGNVPLPLEPLTKSSEDTRHGARNTTQLEDEPEKSSPLRLRPVDVLSAREAKKPHLAISELLEANNDADTQNLQLPSFVSLAVVEKSPVQEPTRLSPYKRMRLDLDVDVPSHDVGRRLPRPAQKDDKQPRPVPLLPAMVTGLHEPPPSAGILPSMEVDARPNLTRAVKTSKMRVKDILAESRRSTHVPPEAMLNTPDLPTVELSKPESKTLEAQSSDTASKNEMDDSLVSNPKKDSRARRARRKWSEEESTDLLAGVKKHGFGKWKQILTDPAYTFHDRTSIDLKDRYRVFVRDHPDGDNLTAQPQYNQQDGSSLRDAEQGKDLEPTSTNTAADHPGPRRTKKRKRRLWTPAEDAALIRGVAKHGFLWTVIHDDPELDLDHRRATDLRDRIRNLYPDGYRLAEARPLRKQVQKVDRTDPDRDAPLRDLRPKPTRDEDVPATTSSQASVVRPATVLLKKRRGRGKAQKTGADVHQAAEQGGVTLPSLALDDDDELDWGDNTLPPLLEWEEIGM